MAYDGCICHQGRCGPRTSTLRISTKRQRLVNIFRIRINKLKCSCEQRQNIRIVLIISFGFVVLCCVMFSFLFRRSFRSPLLSSSLNLIEFCTFQQALDSTFFINILFLKLDLAVSRVRYGLYCAESAVKSQLNVTIIESDSGRLLRCFRIYMVVQKTGTLFARLNFIRLNFIKY